MTADGFSTRLKDDNLALTMVGMSNVGKSYWSNLLSQQMGFRHLCCDDLIENELSEVLGELGYKGISDMAKWLGQPYDQRFTANQQTYLDLEAATLQIIINELEQGRLSGNTIIDTTGSVVHTHPEIQAKLSELTYVIYLEATDDMRQEMFKLYIAQPKPVVWGDIYAPQPDESNQQALERCYPNLLTRRSRLYEQMAQTIISRQRLGDLRSAQDFLDYIRGSLLD